MSETAVVHIVDDDAGVRKSLGMLIEGAGLAVKRFESGEDFLDALDPAGIGCIVLDLRMAGMGGIEVLQRLRAMRCEIPAIIISGHADVPTAIRGMKLGAVDLLQKPFEPSRLLEAVHSAIRASVEQSKKRTEVDAVRARFANLTPREMDLLKMVIAGMPNKIIASELNISIKTVANHRANLMAKTRALNAADLARISMLAGVVPAANAE